MLLLACHIRGVWLALLYLVTVVTSAPAISDWRDRILSYPFLEAKLQWGPHQAIADYRKIEHAMTNPVVTYVKGYNEEAWEPVFEAFSSVFHVYSAAQVADDKRTVISLTAALRNTDINNAETFVNHVWKTLIPSEREAVPDSVPDHIFADWPALNWVSPQTDDQYVNLICFMTLSNLVDPSEPVVSVPEYWGTIRRVPSTITRLGSLITKGHLPGEMTKKSFLDDAVRQVLLDDVVFRANQYRLFVNRMVYKRIAHLREDWPNKENVYNMFLESFQSELDLAADRSIKSQVLFRIDRDFCSYMMLRFLWCDSHRLSEIYRSAQPVHHLTMHVRPFAFTKNIWKNLVSSKIPNPARLLGIVEQLNSGLHQTKAVLSPSLLPGTASTSSGRSSASTSHSTAVKAVEAIEEGWLEVSELGSAVSKFPHV